MRKLGLCGVLILLCSCATGENNKKSSAQDTNINTGSAKQYSSDDDVIIASESWQEGLETESSSGGFTPPETMESFTHEDAVRDPYSGTSSQETSETVIENSEKQAETPEQRAKRERFEKLAKSIRYPGFVQPYKSDAWSDMIDLAETGYPPAEITVAWGKLLGVFTRQNIPDAAAVFQKYANEGMPDAQMGLGFLYATGTEKHSSQSKALLLYTFAAFGGSQWGQMALGYRYFAGIGVAASCEKALDYYRRAATSVADEVSFSGGSSIQRVRLQDEQEGGGYSGIQDNDLIEYYQLLAGKGDIQAQVGLGQLHYQGGRGIPRDPRQALQYFLQAAESGNAVAMAFLGKIYLEGNEEVAASNETALKYFKKASALNNPVGQSGLGLMYLFGKGVEKDTKKAYEYFSKAAEQSWVDGQLWLGNMYYNGWEVPKDYKMASKYYNLASQSGHVLAFYNLADMHATGTGVLRSCPTAVEFFKNVAERGKWGNLLMEAHHQYKLGLYDEALLKYLLLAELGFEVAQSNAAFILDRKDSEIYDPEEMWKRALVYWSRAAAQGYSNARVRLGDYYYYGLGTAVDYETAASHYRIASEQQNNPQAMFNLGYMHELGLGMKQDIHLAKRFYDQAADTSADAKVPVYLALTKLALVFALKNIEEFKLIIGIDTWETLELYGDIYLMSLLIFLIGYLIVFRRAPPNQRNNRQQQTATPRAARPAAAPNGTAGQQSSASAAARQPVTTISRTISSATLPSSSLSSTSASSLLTSSSASVQSSLGTSLPSGSAATSTSFSQPVAGSSTAASLEAVAGTSNSSSSTQPSSTSEKTPSEKKED